MKALHLINKPGQPLDLCQRALTQNDAIMLIEDGIYLLSAEKDRLRQLTEKHTVYFLDPDSQARGISTDIPTITPVDYNSFVELTTEFDRVISWF